MTKTGSLNSLKMHFMVFIKECKQVDMIVWYPTLDFKVVLKSFSLNKVLLIHQVYSVLINPLVLDKNYVIL